MNAMKFVVLLIFVGFVCANVGARQLEEVSKETKLGISISKTVTTANGIGAELNYVSVTTTANNYENSNVDADAGSGGPSGGGSGTVAKSTTGSVIAEGPDYVSASSISYASGGTTAGAGADSDSAGGSSTADGVAYSVAQGRTGEP
ncbi:UPF0540 protein At1g62060 [Brassica napus]|uniref:UPF0540 protein At1g62060 n=1 Tax=Brassica napus TaxID=3708 RepID=UPI00207868B7|nr:UPF0540 protein At1g62060 [Brassica napus]